MAQVCGTHPFDHVWEANLQRAEHHLRSACERWLRSTGDAVGEVADLDAVVAVVVHDLTGDCYFGGNDNLEVEMRTIDDVETICLHRRPRLAPPDLAAIVTACRACVRDAAERWTRSGPASPTAAEVIFDVATVLFQYKLVRRPPRKVAPAISKLGRSPCSHPAAADVARPVTGLLMKWHPA